MRLAAEQKPQYLCSGLQGGRDLLNLKSGPYAPTQIHQSSVGGWGFWGSGQPVVTRSHFPFPVAPLVSTTSELHPRVSGDTPLFFFIIEV